MISVTATSARLPTCPRCSGAVSLTWGRLRDELQGHSYRVFLGRHLRQYSPREIRGALAEATDQLAPLGPDRGRLVEEWTAAARSGDLLDAPAPEAMDRALGAVRAAATERGVAVTEGLALDVFELLSLAIVARALEEEALADDLRPPPGPLGRYLWRVWVGVAGAYLAVTGGATVAGAVGWAALAVTLLGPAVRLLDGGR